MAEPILDIPQSGSSAFPDATTNKNNPELAAINRRLPAYEVLAEYARNHPKNPYIGVAGIWNAQKQHYEYKSYPLEFSQNITDSSGDLMYYQYRFQSEDGGAARVMAALVPEGTAGVAMMARWLHGADLKLETEKWTGASYAVKLTPRKLKGGSGQSVSSGDPSCYYIWTFPNGNITIEEGSCITVTAEPEPMVQEPGHDEAPTGGWENDDPEDGYPGGGGGGGSWDGDDGMLIIFDESFIGTKAECVYNKLNASSNNFFESIQKFDGEFPVSHLKLGVNNSLSSTTYGITYAPENYVIKIEFNENRFGSISDLGKALAITHEVIHAEIYRKMLSAAQQGDLNHNEYTTQNRINYVNSLRNNFPGLYDYYWDRYHPNWNHNMMASHYRSTIADMLQDFDNGRLSRSTYEAVAWAGLSEFEDGTSTIAWQNLPESEKQTVEGLLNYHFFNGPSPCN